VKKYENMFTLFDTIHERDEQTNTARLQQPCLQRGCCSRAAKC